MIQQFEVAKQQFFYGYIIVALAFIINAILGGTLYTFSVFFNPLSSDFGWTTAATSGAFSLYMILHGFFYIVTGKLNDRFGARIVMSGCGFFTGLGYLLMSRTTAIWHLYLFYGVIIAIGMSGGYVPLTSTVTRWFESSKKQGLMVGISVAGIGVGTMIIPPLANWLISNHGWQTSYIVIGVLSLVIIISAAQFIKRAPVQKQQLPDDPNDKQGVSTNPAARGLSLQEAIRTRQFWLLSAAYFGFGIFLQAIMVHIVRHAIVLDISESTAANIFIAIGGLSVIGRITMGSVSDKIGNRSTIIICFALMTAAFSWILMAREAWMLFMFAAVFGFAYGGLVATQSPFIAELFGVTSHGVIFGLIIFIVTIGGAIGPVMAGGIYDITESYNNAFLICCALTLVSIILTLLLRPIFTGGKK